MPKVAFRTLGCRLIQADTDSIAQDLLAPSRLIDQLALVKGTEAGVEAVRGEYVQQVPWEDSRPRAGSAAILGYPAGRS